MVFNIACRASLPAAARPMPAAIKAKCHVYPQRVVPKQSWIDRKLYGYGYTSTVYIPPVTFDSNASNPSDPTLWVAVCTPGDSMSPANTGAFCDALLGHTIDIFDDINIDDITHENILDVLNAVRGRAKIDRVSTGRGDTCAAAFSKTLMLVLEKALHITHMELLTPAVVAAVMEIISMLVFSDHDMEKTLQGQWRSLAARASAILEVVVGRHYEDLDMPLLVQFYEAWARAAPCVNMRASQRPFKFELKEDDDLLCPFHWGTRSAPATPQQAARLLVAMATVASTQGDSLSVFALKYLYPRVQKGVEKLSISELEAVVGAAEHFPWPGQVRSIYPVGMLHAAAKEAARREAFGLEDSAPCGAVMSVAVHSAHCAGLKGDEESLREAIDCWKLEFQAEARALEDARQAALQKSKPGRSMVLRAVAALFGTVAGLVAPGKDA